MKSYAEMTHGEKSTLYARDPEEFHRLRAAVGLSPVMAKTAAELNDVALATAQRASTPSAVTAAAKTEAMTFTRRQLHDMASTDRPRFDAIIALRREVIGY